MDLDNFIIGKTKEKREEIWQKKQQLLSKHRAGAADGKNSQKQQWPTGLMPPSCSNAKIIKKEKIIRLDEI